MTWSPVKFYWQHSLSSLLASSTKDGYDISNLLDGLEGTFWKPTNTGSQSVRTMTGINMPADYFFLAGHNLGKVGAILELQSADSFVDTWTEVACGATRRSLPTSSVISDEIYVFGGYSFQSSRLNDLWKYNPSSNSWTEVACGATRRYAHTAAVVSGEIYVFGGYSFQNCYLNDLWKYNPSNNTWTEVACGATRRNAHSTVVISDEMYVFGGYSFQGSVLNDLWKYNPSSNAWTEVACGAIGRYAHSAAVMSGEVYIFGGRISPSPSNYLNDLWKYNPTSNAWTEVACGATGRIYHSAVSIDSEICIFGGENYQGSKLNDLWKYNPSSNAWTEVACGATGRYQCTMNSIADKIYVFGGYSFQGSRLNDLWRADRLYTAVFSKTFTGSDSGKVFLQEFSQITKPYWRVVISGMSALPYVAMMQWGLKTELGHLSVKADPQEQEKVSIVNVGQFGHVLGSHEYYTQRTFDLKIENVDETIYQKVTQWWNECVPRQFVVAWESSSHSSDVWLMRSGQQFYCPTKVGGLYRDIEIELLGRREEQ